MLRSLQIRNYVLIDSLDVQFPAGLSIITGQTGAGKSILLGALGVLLGSRQDVSTLGDPQRNCVVEAVFESASDAVLREMVQSEGLDWNGGVLTIRRVLAPSGRSRAFVNDEPVTVGFLADITRRLVDIHSQHQTLILKDSRFQLSLLDHFAGNGPLLERCSAAFRELSSLRSRLAEVEAELARMASERDWNETRFAQLRDARLRDGELEELDAEQKKLANAEEIKGGLYAVSGLFSSEDGMSSDSKLRQAFKALEKVSKYIPSASDLAARVESVRLELDDILAEVESLEESVDISPERLQAVEERMSELYGLMQKHGCASVAELIALRDTLSGMLSDSGALEDEKIELGKNISRVSKEYESLCKELHAARAKAVDAFSAEIQASLRDLELDRAVFRAELLPAEPGQSGSDSVRYMFSSTGTAPVEVSKCASGGEMSRIMLCLKAMMARYTAMPSMIFDEIDTGVSGSAADKMGSMICRMGEHMQVFAITHLPQVAAKGHAHFLVTKTVAPDGKAITDICQIEGEARIREIARMLSGSTITPAAIANARALLGLSLLQPFPRPSR